MEGSCRFAGAAAITVSKLLDGRLVTHITAAKIAAVVFFREQNRSFFLLSVRYRVPKNSFSLFSILFLPS